MKLQPAQDWSAGGRRRAMEVSIKIQRKPESREKCKRAASPGNSLGQGKPLLAPKMLLCKLGKDDSSGPTKPHASIYASASTV